MKYLFIGGSKDGERITIQQGTRTVEVPVLEEFKLLPGKLFKQTNEPSFKKELYRKETFSASTDKLAEKHFHVFILNKLSFADVMAMLIEGYRKPKE